MKAIYEVSFYTNSPNKRDTVADTRRIAGEATTKGFKKVATWAESVCAEDEWVGGIKLLVTEML